MDLELVPAFVYSLYLTLYKTDISLRWTLNAGPKGVRLEESWLYIYAVQLTLGLWKNKHCGPGIIKTKRIEFCQSNIEKL